MIGFGCGSGAATRRMPPDAGSGGIVRDGHGAARRARPESQSGIPPVARSLRPPLIRWGHGGDGEGIRRPLPALDGSLASRASSREGIRWGGH